MAGNVVKVGAHISQQLFPWRQIAGQRGLDALLEPSKDLVQHRGVESFLVLEVVIEQGLVDAGGAGDGVSAGPGHAFAGKFTDGSLQDGGPAFFGASAGSQAGFGKGGFHAGLVIN